MVLPAAAAFAHDGIHGIKSDGEHRRMPEFAVVATAPDFVRTHAQYRGLGDSAFTVIGLPDTQNYASGFPAVFTAQTAWVVDQRAALDIRFVSHFGDIVNNADQPLQWARADESMSLLDDAGIIYGVCPGNHDITASGVSGQPYIPQSYLEHFGPSRFDGRVWFGGSSPSGMSSYQYFSAGGMEFLSLHLECDTPVRELAWAQGVLDENRDRPVLLTTHRYLQDAEDYTSGVPLVSSGRYPSVWYAVEGTYTPDGIQSNEFFDWFVRKNPSIFMVNCGHFHEEYRQVSTNVAGLPVHEVLADFQDDPNGGDGWMRIMRFDVAANTIDVDTYSPTLAAIRTADESDFTLAVPFDAYRMPPSSRFVALQEGVAGYAGTQDTWISQANPNTSYGQNDTRVVDDDTANSLFSDQRGQGLLRWDGLVGAGPRQVPLGAQVVSATLVIDVPDDIDTPFYNPDFLVHRMTRGWDESSTWNSLGDGLSVPEDMTPAIAVFSGDNQPDDDTMRRVDVTAAVAAWVAGEPNHGLAILPEIINGNDDGIEIRASENSNTILRPRIEVVFVPPYQASPADIDRDGTVGGADLAILLSAWGMPSPIADLDADGVVGGGDLAVLLSSWG
ncbi:MAG: hypothetical protein RL136_1694 [Planctomycetota bacterium]|jgi:hypothetical protein